MRPSFSLLAAASLLSFTASPSVCHAQQAPLNSEIKITKIDPSFMDSPKINAAGYTKKSTGRPSPWLEVEVTFDRAALPKEPKFAEELTFNYYILLKNDHVTEDKKRTMLTGSVTHVSVPEDKNLHSVAFVAPRTLARLFDGKAPVNAQQAVVDIGVTVTGKGGLMALSALNSPVQGDKGWWDNAAAFTTVSGAVLNKNETPFAPLEWDFYEAIKSKSGN